MARVLAITGLLVIMLPLYTLWGWQARAAEEVPALQITAPNGRRSTMIGSVHIPLAGLRQPVTEVLDGTKSFVIESSISQGPQPSTKSLQDALDPQVYASLAATGKMQRASWAKWLSNNQVLQLRSQLVCIQPELQDSATTLIETMLAARNAAAADAIAYALCAPPGMQSRDSILAGAAAIRGIPTKTLETQVAVQRQREKVPDRIYNNSLRHAFSSDITQDYARLRMALNAGDYEKVLQLVAESNDPEDAAEYYQIMVAERNAAWMPVLRGFLDDGNAFVVVGAAHLAGPLGLMSLLKASGYKVDSIELSSVPQ